MQQQQAQIQQQTAIAQMEHEAALNTENNETKIIVANINAQARMYDEANVVNDGIEEPMSEEAREKLKEQIRQFDARLALDKERLAFDKHKADVDARLKEKQINKSSKSNGK